MNANILPLGDRSQTKNKIRSLEDLYGDNPEAKKRLKEHREELFKAANEEDDFPSFGTWGTVDMTQITDFPLCIAPYAVEAKELDPEELNPKSQKYFWMKESNNLSLRPTLENLSLNEGNGQIEVKVDPEEKVIIKDGCVIRVVPPKIDEPRGGMRGGRGRGRGRPPPRGNRGGRGGGRGGFGFGGGRGGGGFGQDRGWSPPRDRRSMSSRRSPPRRSPDRHSRAADRHTSPPRRSPDRRSQSSRRSPDRHSRAADRHSSPPRRSPDRRSQSSRRSPDRHSRAADRQSPPPRRSPSRSYRQSPDRRHEERRPSETRQPRGRSPSSSPEPRGYKRETSARNIPSPPPISLSTSSRRSRPMPEVIDLVDDSPPHSSRRRSEMSVSGRREGRYGRSPSPSPPPQRRRDRRESPDEYRPPSNVKKSKDDTCKPS